MTPKQIKRFWKFVKGDDLDFYEDYTINLSDKEQHKLLKDNPDYMPYLSEKCDKIKLLRDKMFRNILRMIKKYKGGL